MSEIVIKLEIPGLDQLVKVLESLGGENRTPPQNNPVGYPATGQTFPVPTPVIQQAPLQLQAPQPQTPLPTSPQTPLLQQTGAQTPMQAAPLSQIQVPTTAVAQEYTQDQLAVASAGLVTQGKQARLIEVLNSFGVHSLVELGKERYGEFATILRGEGAVI